MRRRDARRLGHRATKGLGARSIGPGDEGHTDSEGDAQAGRPGKLAYIPAGTEATEKGSLHARHRSADPLPAGHKSVARNRRSRVLRAAPAARRTRPLPASARRWGRCRQTPWRCDAAASTHQSPARRQAGRQGSRGGGSGCRALGTKLGMKARSETSRLSLALTVAQHARPTRVFEQALCTWEAAAAPFPQAALCTASACLHGDAVVRCLLPRIHIHAAGANAGGALLLALWLLVLIIILQAKAADTGR